MAKSLLGAQDYKKYKKVIHRKKSVFKFNHVKANDNTHAMPATLDIEEGYQFFEKHGLEKLINGIWRKLKERNLIELCS